MVLIDSEKPVRFIKTKDQYKLNIDIEDGEGNMMSVFNPSVSQSFITIRMASIVRIEEDNKEYYRYTNEYILSNRDTNSFNVLRYDIFLENASKISQGLEDIRIIHAYGKVWFTASLRRQDEFFDSVIGYISEDMNAIEKITYRFSYPNNNIKNLLPLLSEDNKFYVVDIYKLKIYEISEDGLIQKEQNIVNLDDRAKIFGSSNFIQLGNDTYGCLAHVYFLIGVQAYYLHYWIEIKKVKDSWIFHYMSTPFVFETFKIDFPSGIAWTEQRDIEILAGVWNKEVYRYVTSLKEFYV